MGKSVRPRGIVAADDAALDALLDRVVRAASAHDV